MRQAWKFINGYIDRRVGGVKMSKVLKITACCFGVKPLKNSSLLMSCPFYLPSTDTNGDYEYCRLFDKFIDDIYKIPDFCELEDQE